MGKLSKNKKKKLKRKAKRQQRLLDERLLDLQRMEELDGAPWRLSEDTKEDEENTQSEQINIMFLPVLRAGSFGDVNIRTAFRSDGKARFFLCVTVNGNGPSKGSPESGSSWQEDSCNGNGPLRFSSPGSALSAMSGSILSATSESAVSTLSGYSTERSLLSPNGTCC